MTRGQEAELLEAGSRLIGGLGFAQGSFARGPNNYDEAGKAKNGSVPQGVMGNWAVGNDNYRASGVFAGSTTLPATN